MATITKRDLVIKLSTQSGLTQVQVQNILQGFLDEISQSLINGDTVMMRNFGTFEIKETKEKVGRNPKKPSEDIHIPSRKIVKFKPGKELKEEVKNT